MTFYFIILGEELDLDSSEARIRNWQLFYGAIENNSSVTSNSQAFKNDTDSNLSEVGLENPKNLPHNNPTTYSFKNKFHTQSAEIRPELPAVSCILS